MFTLFNGHMPFSVAARRAMLRSFGSKYYFIKWKTKDGRIREATLKTWQLKSLTYGKPPLPNPCEHIEHLWTAVDMNKHKSDPVRSWVNVDVRNILEIKCGWTRYVS